jgi:cytochrome oxidase Cu insertion factor (SCO1/SenC/PrrC family)
MRSTAILGLAIVLGGAFTVAGSTATAEPAKSTELESVVSLGEHWYGDEIDLKDLKGKVVLLEFWGLN